MRFVFAWCVLACLRTREQTAVTDRSCALIDCAAPLEFCFCTLLFFVLMPVFVHLSPVSSVCLFFFVRSWSFLVCSFRLLSVWFDFVFCLFFSRLFRLLFVILPFVSVCSGFFPFGRFSYRFCPHVPISVRSILFSRYRVWQKFFTGFMRFFPRPVRFVRFFFLSVFFHFFVHFYRYVSVFARLVRFFRQKLWQSW